MEFIIQHVVTNDIEYVPVFIGVATYMNVATDFMLLSVPLSLYIKLVPNIDISWNAVTDRLTLLM